MVVVDEGGGSHAADRRPQVEARQALRRAERADPFLHDRRGRVRRELETEREHGQGEARRVGADLGPQRPHLVEESRHALLHALRFRLREELLDAPDLAAPGVDHHPHEGGSAVEGGEQTRRTREVVLQLRDVVQADREHDLVGMVLARETLVGDPFLPGGPSPQRHVEDLDGAALPVE